MNSAKRILVVDDEPDILKIVIFRLKKSGYEVTTADNGKLGLELAEKERPDLILLDLRLPVMNGSEVCRRLKSNDSLKQIPVIFLTASAAGEIEERTRGDGAEDYIIKPFEPEELLVKVKKYLG